MSVAIYKQSPMHKHQRGAGGTRPSREVQIEHWRAALCRVEDSRLGEPGRVKAENIAHRSDLACLCMGIP